MEKKNILFTFDYELFLGKRSGEVDACVIEPTRKLLDVFSQYNSKAIFFVDTTWLIRLKEVAGANPAAKKDYEKVSGQLCNMLNKGHYIFPHLHPHWLDANYLPEINQWQLTNYTLYRFHSLDKDRRGKLFDDSIKVLKEILGNNYEPIAYRAGGWSIQPFEDFEPLFRKHGVKYDFSVLPGTKCISTGQQYDFSDVNVTQPYSFSKDVAVPGIGEYMEFPISITQVSAITSFLNKVLLKYLVWKGYHSYGKGNGIVTETFAQSKTKGEMISIELLNRVKLPLYLQFLAKNSYMQFIAHPKMLSGHNIDTFVQFIGKAYSLYTVETDFKKMIN